MQVMSHPLRTHRKAAGMSLKAVADAVGSAESTISRIETWSADPSLELIRRLCAIFPELTANDFLTAPAADAGKAVA